MASTQNEMPSPQYPEVASLGGSPTNSLDTPICAVFLTLFVIGAATHMTILQLNRRRGHKFLMSGLMFGFCMSRITTCILRIVWANNLTNVNIAIAAQILVAAGVILLIIMNVIFAQRILRAEHPNFGWHRFVHFFFMGMYILIVLSLVLLITLTVYSFFTTNQSLRNSAHDCQLYGQAYFMYMAFFPILAVALALLIPKTERVEKFGTGRLRTKITILLIASALLALGAGFRFGVNAAPPRFPTDPAWYHSKACFYIFNFTVEILVIYLYAILRVDLRFHIPNGSKARGDYAGGNKQEITSSTQSNEHGLRIMTEEETFDNEQSPPVAGAERTEKEARLEDVEEV